MMILAVSLESPRPCSDCRTSGIPSVEVLGEAGESVSRRRAGTVIVCLWETEVNGP